MDVWVKERCGDCSLYRKATFQVKDGCLTVFENRADLPDGEVLMTVYGPGFWQHVKTELDDEVTHE